MKNISIIVLLLVFCNGCKKDDNEDANRTVEVTYTIETSVGGFSEVKYKVWDKTNGHTYKAWAISSPGTYSVKSQIPIGTEAEVSATHPGSNKFKLILKGSDGSIIDESTTITRVAGPPSYYYGRAIGVAK